MRRQHKRKAVQSQRKAKTMKPLPPWAYDRLPHHPRRLSDGKWQCGSGEQFLTEPAAIAFAASGVTA